MLVEERRPRAAPPATPVPSRTPRAVARRHGWTLTVVGALVLAALSLLPFDASPTYDPWAWLVWGREITELDLDTVDGPSWKPLPVLFTTLFAPLGDAAPALWLVVARAGALLGVVFAFRVGCTLGGLVGGTGAAVALLVAPWVVRNAGLGNSESLTVACVLAMLDRHLAGRHRQAFAFGVVAGLLRPECWPFLFAYGCWLVYRDHRQHLKAVALGFGCLPVLWLGPELWGSGDPFRAAGRAKQPRADAATFDDNPALKVLENGADLVPAAGWVGLVVAALLAATRLVPREKVKTVAALMVVVALWLGLVASMTKDGFSGNARYMFIPVSLGIVVAASAFGWLAELVPRRLHPALAVVAAAAFTVPWAGQIDRAVDEVRHQSALPHRLAEAIDDAGGKAELLRCGDPYTVDLMVPQVAWQLGVHTSEVALEPRAPAVTFRAQVNPGGRVAPRLDTLGLSPQRTLATADRWRIVGSCTR